MPRWTKQRAAEQREAATIPEIRIGDLWELMGRSDSVMVVGIEPVKGWAWPLVYLTDQDGVKTHVGAPAFKHSARLLRRGWGTKWAPQ